MQSTHTVGIDPGIVHTGVVSTLFIPHKREVQVQSEAIAGLDHEATKKWIDRRATSPRGKKIWIEGYRPRHHMQHDNDMVAGVRAFQRATNGTVLQNTGIKTVVKPEVLKLLGIWNFTTTTHHQDLRSAARIMVLGMMKDPELNTLLADIIRDHLNNHTWKVTQQ